MNTALLANIDALLITNPTNIRYLTGFVGMDERDSYLLITREQAFLFTNSLYREEAKSAKSQMLNATLETVEISRDNPIAKELGKTLKKISPLPFKGLTFKGIRMGFEERNLTVAEFATLKKALPGVTLIATKNRIENLRMIKRPEEMNNIRQAAKLTDECFDFILAKIKPGITESDLAWEIESFIKIRGAQLAFPPIVAFNKNSSQPHHTSSQRFTLTDKSLVLLDFGARVNGYCSDMTRVVFVGKPKDEWIQTYAAVVTAQRKSLDYLASHPPGEKRDGRRADREARTVIAKSKQPDYPHGLGHAVGLEIHEAPRLTVKKNAILLPGMVFTVEPGVYIPDRYGIRIEDLVLLNKHGIDVLSTSSKELTIL